MYNLFNPWNPGCSIESHKAGKCHISEHSVVSTIAYGINDILRSGQRDSSLRIYSRDGGDYFVTPIKNYNLEPCGYVWTKKANSSLYYGVEYSGVGAAVFKVIMRNPDVFYGYLQAGEQSTEVHSSSSEKIDSPTLDILLALRGDGKTFYVHNDQDVDLEAMANMIDERILGFNII